MTKNLLLVDLENRHKVDFSQLDKTFKVIIFVGHAQNPPKATIKSWQAFPAARLEIVRIEGDGKNALDFHIACQLGRTFETARHTRCHVLSDDTGFDPLIASLNKNGLWCQRVSSLDELLLPDPVEPRTAAPVPQIDLTVCPRCHKANTIDLHGGKWCVNCGSFASPPGPAQLPSNQPGFVEVNGQDHRDDVILTFCSSCNQKTDMTGGIYDDGEWMCGGCFAGYVD
ncbi:PIN domain-containing protein [Polaromonas sp.]|uniref:PIN domain-containing protein n=1 Tax=Polaromonas sp. TaxID=1869339 RepID=UPI003BAB1ABF